MARQADDDAVSRRRIALTGPPYDTCTCCGKCGTACQAKAQFIVCPGFPASFASLVLGAVREVRALVEYNTAIARLFESMGIGLQMNRIELQLEDSSRSLESAVSSSVGSESR